MEGEYYDTNPAAMREDMDGSRAGDGQGEGAGVADRGLFGRHHGYDGECASEVGSGGYGGRPPMPYDGGYGGGYGGSPRAGEAYEGGYGSAAPPAYGEADDASHVAHHGDRRHHGGHHGHSKKDEDEVGHERKLKHRAEAAAAAALGYGLYERHQRDDAEEKLEGVHGYDSDGRKKPDNQKYDY